MILTVNRDYRPEQPCVFFEAQIEFLNSVLIRFGFKGLSIPIIYLKGLILENTIMLCPGQAMHWSIAWTC
jgi:hypothetical protein